MRPWLRVLAACLAVAAPALSAQSGRIVYRVTTRMEVPPEARARMQAMGIEMPSSMTEHRQTTFSETAALTEAAPDPEATPADDDSIEGQIRRFRRDNVDRMYVDLDAGTSLHQRDFLGRTFLVETTPPAVAWRLTDESAEFLGQPCLKAVGQRDSTTYEAWFAPGVPVAVGPDGFGGLPGAILVLTVDGGQRAFVATELHLEDLPAGAPAAPTEGQRMTHAEFVKLVEERVREMSGGRNGGVFILRQ